MYIGNYTEDYADLNFKFTTRDGTGLPTTLLGTPALSVYKSNDATQTTAGITLSVDFDTITGLNNVKIDLSADAFYAVGEDYAVVITTGTVDGVSVVGEVVGHFSIENRFNEVAVTSIAANAITDAAINADAFTAAKFAADVGNEFATALLDLAAGVETGFTVRQTLRVLGSALGGIVSGAATTTITFRNMGDTDDVIIATVDADGNRSAVVLSP